MNALEKVRSEMLSTLKKEQEESKSARKNTKRYEHQNVDVVNEGTQIVLPKDMSKPEAIEWINRKIEEDNTAVRIHEEVEAYPLDGAYALMQVLKQIYGWVNPVPTPGFFGDSPPVMVNLEVDHGVNTQVIWGGFSIPGIDGQLQTGSAFKEGKAHFVIRGNVKQKHRETIKQIAALVREYVKAGSVYKGKAILLRTTDEGGLDMELPPKFLDISKTDEKVLIFADTTNEQIKTHVFTPIEYRERCKAAGIPVKRNVLLEGPFGTGKTLTAHVAAKKAVANGWTFIYLDRVSGLKQALLFARQYGPAVIFAEDIDRVMSGERDVEVDDILNTIDGIDSKNDETIVILTTNEVQKIEKAMIRPGRLDAVIHVGPPDAKAAEKMMRAYAGDLLDASEDLTEAGKQLDGQIPATIAEVVKRSKLYAISTLKDGEPLKITGEALYHSAVGMAEHLKILADEKEEMSTEEKLGTIVKDVIEEAMEDVLEESREGIIKKSLREVYNE